MAITGRFLADFSDFMTAVQKADVALKGMETGAGDVTKMLNKMTDSFSGRKIVQEATLMAQAFELLASQGIALTNKELQKMGATAEEAIAKLRAGGEEIPAGIQKIADAAKASAVAMKALDDQAQAVQKNFAAFSGDQIIAEAHAVAKAVEQIGGASKLTAAEQQKVNQTVTEAIAKYAALGQTAPKALQNLAAATKAVAGPMSSLQDHLKGIQQHVSTFSGDKIIQEATQIARAVEQIGGASKLTATEQAKVNATMTEAIAKYKALGQVAPQAMHDLAQATKQVKPALDQAQSGLDKMFTTLKGAAAAFGIAFSAQAVISFVGKVFDAAEAVQDLADQLGVSTDAVQQFKYAAQQGGATIDDVGRAIQKMNQNLAEGTKDTYAALKTLGLGFEEIRRMSPEDAFLAITDALNDIADPMLRARLQMELFGKAGAALGASIAGDFRKMAESADFMSKQTIKDLADAEQAWENLGNKVILISGQIIAGTIRAVEQVTKSWKNFLIFAANASTMGVGVAASLASATNEAEKTAPAIAKVNDQIGESKVQIEAAAKAATKLRQEWDTYISGALKRGQDQITYLKQLEAGLENVSDTMQTFVSKHLEALHDRGRKILQLTADDAVRLGLALNQGMVGGKATISGLGDEFAQLGQKIKPIPPALEDAAEASRRFNQSLTAMAQALANLGKVSGGFGKVAQDMATLVNAIATGRTAADTMAKGLAEVGTKGKTGDALIQIGTAALTMASAFMQATETGSAMQKTLKGAALGASIGKQWGLIGAAIGAAAGALAGFIRSLNAARNAVKDFAKSFGGFDELRAQLRILGDEGERLWKKLTQGSGTPAQAQATANEITKALATIPKALNDMVRAATIGGQVLDAAMVPYIEDLIRAGELTTENANLLLGLPAAGVPAFKEVEEAAEALGLPIDAIGESIKQMKFTDAADKITKHLDVLQRAGADMDAVLHGARDQIQKLVDEAQQTGKSLPESMKPFLEQMVKSGYLTDLFGDKLDSLDDLHFTKPLEESVADLIEALHELVDVIKDDVGGALDDIGKKVVRPKIQPEHLPPTGAPSGAAAPPPPPTTPEPAAPPPALAEGEAKIREAPIEPPPATLTVIMEIDGRTAAASVVPYMPGEAKRFVAT